MKKTPIEFNEKHIDNKGFELDFAFYGDTKDTRYDYEDTRKAILNYISTSDHSDFVKDVTTLRSMLSDVREEYSIITYEDIDRTESAKYINNVLMQYDYAEKNNESFATEGVSVSYSKGSDVVVFLPKDGINTCNREIINKYKKRFEDKISSLKLNPSIKMTPEDNLILYVYYLFYGEYPDFSDNNTFIKFQAMNTILSLFRVKLYSDTYLDNYYSLYVSTKLKNIFEKLYPLGKINKLDTNVDLTEKQVLLINIIGSNIASYLKSSKDYIAELKELAKIISESEIVDKNLRSNYIYVDIKKVNSAAKLYRDVSKQIVEQNLRD